MSAKTVSNMTYYASCDECGWDSEDFDSPKWAERAAEEHNREDHA